MKGRPPAAALDRVIGQRLRRRREALGVTTAELADRVGVSPQQLHKYETGVNRVATSRLVAACAALGLSAAEVLEEAMAAGQLLAVG
jgi:transcriptional regulator with XRE-family HTH domain